MSSYLPSPLRRRLLLGATLTGALGSAWGRAEDALATVPPAQTMQFPRDLGSHPDTAIEWWYLTGELLSEQRRFGFQLTFFRARVPTTQQMTSAFAARQLIFCHAALTDVAGQRLLYGQRIARSSGHAAVDLASASEKDTDVQLGDWSLRRLDAKYLARLTTPDFSLSLTLHETQALLLQGDQGLSRKGPLESETSHYYSLPQMESTGQLLLSGVNMAVRGRAWLDHEWSQALLPAQAVGWDWIGMNLHDGSALTAFRLRRPDGSALWAGGSWRSALAKMPLIFSSEQIDFQPRNYWKSPATGIRYPVEWSVQINHPQLQQRAPQCQLTTVRAVIDAQELDSRQSTGAIYWEGLCDLLSAQGHVLGQGYLEMTGYASPLTL